MSDLLFPVYEFRPLPSFHPSYRFADGKWIEDDGEYDLAFTAGQTCMYVCMPYHRNIMWGWTTGHWAADQGGHPGGNSWHYMLREGESAWGKPWGRDAHPNELAGRRGMDFLVSKHRGANGTGVDFHLDEPVIAAGLLRLRDTKEIVRFPEKPLCMYCSDDTGAAQAIARGQATALKARAAQ